jgi:hypothetical protein
MADLICSCACSDELLIHEFPDECGALDFGFPYLIALQNKNAVNAFGTNGPTVAQLEALNLPSVTNQTHISFIGPLTNGKKSESGRQSETGADTIDGMEYVYSQIIKIEGMLKFLNKTIIADLTKLNCYSRVRIWTITSKGYIWGGATGFIVPNFFSEWLSEGFGKTSYIPISYEYMVDRAHDYSATTQDDDYLTLENA